MSQPEVNTALADLTGRRLRLIGLPDDRRRHERMRLSIPLPARFGRIEGTLTDVSERGARLRHRQPLHPGTETRLIFDWGTSWFNCNARALSTRLVVATEGDQFYESRIQFLEVPPASKQTLAQVEATLRNSQLRKWVGNMMGEILAGAITKDEIGKHSLLRYRLVNDRWIVRTADDDEPQPVDGFILPSSVGEEEIKTVCAAYRQLDRNGRQLLRLFAAAAVDD
jgi:hypothetical protein